MQYESSADTEPGATSCRNLDFPRHLRHTAVAGMRQDAIVCRSTDTPLDRAESAIGDVLDWVAQQPGDACGDVVIRCRKIIDRTEAASAEATRRFEKSGGYRADGALGMVPWLRDKGNMSGGQAAQHVEVARKMEELPRTGEALARGEIGYEH